MADRVAEILEAHLKLARRQLEFARSGTNFSLIDAAKPGLRLLPITERGLVQRIANLEEALARHAERIGKY